MTDNIPLHINTKYPSGLIGVLLLLIATLCAGILYYNDGHFIYILDDSYLHLALAKQIAIGGYGFNRGEFSSPSSSIIWPFVLAPFAGWENMHIVPFLINSLCCVLTALILQRRLMEVYPYHASLLTFSVLFVLNGVGLIFTGMEHSLQVLLAVYIVSQVIGITEGQKPEKWLWLALLIAPLVRYELLALTWGAVLLLSWHRHHRFVVPACVGLGLMACFSYFLWVHDGNILPASILAKLEIPNDIYNLIDTWLITLFVCIQMAGFFKQRGRFYLYGVQIAALIAHLTLAKTGSFSRYEIYLSISSALILLYYLPQSNLAHYLKRPWDVAITGCFCILMLLVYIASTLSVPASSHAIYSQQVQMQRLLAASGFSSVAANDVGYLAFKGFQHVEDLWGVGDVQRHKDYSSTNGTIFHVVEQKHIPLVMIYPRWFAHQIIPTGWIKVGVLEFHNFPALLVRVTERDVDIYATSKKAFAALQPVVTQWQSGLPKYATFKPYY